MGQGRINTAIAFGFIRSHFIPSHANHDEYEKKMDTADLLEKHYVADDDDNSPLVRQRPTSALKVVFLSFVALFALFRFSARADWLSCALGIAHPPEHDGVMKSNDDLCPQADVVTPYANNDIWQVLNEYYSTDTFLAQAVNWLGGAVKIP